MDWRGTEPGSTWWPHWRNALCENVSWKIKCVWGVNITTGILIINQLDALISQIYFCNKTLHVSDSYSFHRQEFFTVHTAVVYVIQVLLCVRCKTPDDGQRNCPKRVEFYYKSKFEKLMHLVGFILRINHDARSSKRQITTGLKV